MYDEWPKNVSASPGGENAQQLLVGLAKIAVAAALMGAVCHAVVAGSHAFLRTRAWARIADVAIGVPAGMASFYAIAAALRVPELAHTRAQLLSRFRGAD